MTVVSKEPTRTRATDTVLNQPPPLVNYNLYSTDTVLKESIKREGADWAEAILTEFGAIAGSAEALNWACKANEYAPVLKTHDRFGSRIDEVEFHPHWHRLMELSVRFRLHNLPWVDKRPGAHVARAALIMLAGQLEAGHGCPISMTYSGYPVISTQPELASAWLPLLASNTYDSRFMPVAGKSGALIGMGMTEKQGGSDVRANTTSARPAGSTGPAQEYYVTGHKWFFSAPMCDAFLVLAQTGPGPTCFLMPRWTPDGRRNNIFIQRLKNKLGNRSNASSEVEFQDALAWMIGEEGRGVPTIIEMVNHTRLDCALSSAALMRQGLAQALHHASHRMAFGKRLIEQPLMRAVLADLAVESEAATLLAMRLAGAFDRRSSESENAFRRIATAIAKYWICKRAPAHIAECLECLGGNGYVEDSVMPRLFRESPLNSIWEGSSNVICLDVLRALSREAESFDALMAEIEQAKGENSLLDSHIGQLKELVAITAGSEGQGRRLVESLALALQASLLLRYSPPAVSEAFCSGRLANARGFSYGSLPASCDSRSILDRALW